MTKLIAVLHLLIPIVRALVAYDNISSMLERFNLEVVQYSNLAKQASWIFQANISTESRTKSIQSSSSLMKYVQGFARTVNVLWNKEFDNCTIRQLTFLNQFASRSPEVGLDRSEEILSRLIQIYSNSCIEIESSKKPLPLTKNRCLSLYPDLVKVLSTTENTSLAASLWRKWRLIVGPVTKPLYLEYYKLKELGLKVQGWSSYSNFVSSLYENADFIDLSKEIWNEIKPLYEELHAYVRYKLSEKYGDVQEDSAIPAHLFNDMWATKWHGVYNIVRPFPDEPHVDVTGKLRSRYDVIGMFGLAESFFTSIGWGKLNPRFWTRSIFFKPDHVRNMFCQPSAWDMNVEKDVRIKMCASVHEDDFYQVHHQMGHIYYHLLYWNQPFLFRDGANPAFHEAVSAMFALDVKSPRSLFKIGITNEITHSEESEINYLLRIALEDVASIPYNYLVELWTIGVLDGTIKDDEYQSRWWGLREKYQGIRSPFTENEKSFDPGANLQILDSHGYKRNIISDAMRFSIYEAVSKEAGCTSGLFNCTIRGSYIAGKMLRRALQLGRSKPWQKVYKSLTGELQVTGKAIGRYFHKLHIWLRKNRREKGYKIGWRSGANNFKKLSVCNMVSIEVLYVVYILSTLIFVAHI